MVEFRRRLFKERRYRLPLRWVLLAAAGGLLAFLVWTTKRLFR